MEDNIQYSLSPISDDPYDNGIAYEAPQNGPKRNTPPPRAERRDKEEFFYLFTMLRKQEKDIKRKKFLRLVYATLGFTAFWFIASCVSLHPIGIQFLYAFVGSAFFSMIHVAINAPIFYYLESKNRDDQEILDRIERRINEITGHP